MLRWLSNLLKREWFLGAIAGIVATIIGFLLAMLWDVYKMRTEGREREEATVAAITEEFQANRGAIDRNIEVLQEELAILIERKSVVQPLSLLQTSAWDLVKLSRPQRLLVPGALLKLREVVIVAAQINEEIRSRETYRLHNLAMSNYHERLRLYDQSLLDALTRLRALIVAYDTVVRRN